MGEAETTLKMWAAHDRMLAVLRALIRQAKAYEGPPDTQNHFLRCDLQNRYAEAKAAFEAVPYDDALALAAIAQFLERMPREMGMADRS